MNDLVADFCPYKGLQPYTEADRAYFFGRERDREIIISNLYAAPLTVLYGASGVGKSSILLAGVVPELRETPRVAVVVFREWQDAEFKASLVRAVQAELARSAGKELAVDPQLPFDEFLAQSAGALRGQLFFIFDQFEEYFLYHPPSQLEENFDAELARTINRQEIRANFMLSMREDGLSRLDRFQGRIPNLLGNLLRLDHLDRQAAEDAIRLPLAEYNRHLPASQAPVSIEDGLVEVLLEEVKTGKVALDQARQGMVAAPPGGAPGEARIETPFLQMVLTRLWREETSAGSRRLQFSTLTRLGGTESIARTHLDEKMKHLNADERTVAASLFRYLVTPDGRKIAQDPGALAAWAEVPEPQARAVLGRLSADMRILRVISAAGQAARYEIFHDTLAPAILDWRARYVQEQERAEAAQQLAGVRRRFYRRLALVGLIGVLLVVVVIVLIALVFSAYRQQKESQSREWVVMATSQLLVNPEQSLRLSQQAVEASLNNQALVVLRQSLLESRVRVVLRGHTDKVASAAFSPDGTLLATAGADGTARIWEAATGRELASLAEHHVPASDDTLTSELSSVAFSPDGRFLVTTVKDNAHNAACIWELATKRLAVAPLKHPDELRSASFSADGKRVITASSAFIQIWDSATGESLGKWNGLTEALFSAAFSADGKWLITAGEDGKARIWDAATHRLKTELVGHQGYVWSAAFSSDGKWAVTGGDDRTARVWEAGTGRLLAELRGHTGRVNTAVFSANGHFVVTASDDDTALLWETATWSNIARLRGHTGKVSSAAFSPDGRLVVTASQDNTARLWDISAECGKLEFAGHGDQVLGAVFSPDGKLVVTAGADNTARVWESATGSQIAQLTGHSDWVKSAAFSPDGKRIVTASDDKSVRFWDAVTGQPMGEKLARKAGLKAAVFSPDGKLVAMASGTTAQLWEAATGQVQELEGHQGSVYSVAFSPDGKLLITASLDKTARLWRTTDRQMLWELKGHTNAVECASFSPDGRLAVTASRDRTARVWEVSSGRQLVELRGHIYIVSCAVFSPNGEVLATASEDGTVRLWETRTWQSLSQLRGHQRGVNSVAFSPDGQLIVTASKDKTARLYRCAECGAAASLTGLAGQRLALTDEENKRILREVNNQ